LIHTCSSLSLGEAWFEQNGSDTFLNLNRVATEDDLENDHYLEYVGETIETVEIRVAFCPYCGEKLSSDDAVIIPQFRYHNFGSR